MADLQNISLTLYAQTDVGMVRSGNEDNFLILDLTTGTSWTAGDTTHQKPMVFSQGYYGSLLAVSDGMGGALAGEVASRLAVETVRDRMLQLQAHKLYGQLAFPERLRVAIEEANLLINGESVSNPEHKGLGATFTAAGIQGNRVYFGQVGDSRAYLLRQGKIIRITKDQSLVQQLIDAGQITEEEAETHSYRNVILQALGAHGNVNVEVNSIKLLQGDTLVLCSDGLSGKVRADEIARLVQASSELGVACQGLIALANERGGEDNITVLIVQFSGTGLAAPGSEPIEPEIIARMADTPTELVWEEAPDTEPLGGSAPTEKLGTVPIKGTEPLASSIASVFTPPTTTEQPRAQTPVDRPARNDTRERKGPVTSVFSIGEYTEDAQVVAAFEQPAQTREISPAAVTASVEAPLPTETIRKAETADDGNLAKPDPRRRFGLFFLLLTIVGVAIVGFAGVWYFNDQEAKRKNEAEAAEQRRKELEQTERKQELIDGLKTQIEIVERDFRAAKSNRNKEKWDRVSDELQKVGEKFDKVKLKPASMTSDIEDECKDIEKALRKVRDDIKELQGLVPRDGSALDPVTC
jgi:protein phosphatase